MKAFINSGIIENYCLGICSKEEKIELLQMAALHPIVRSEIEKVTQYFENLLLENAIAPKPSVKNSVLRSIYKKNALVDRTYVPLIENDSATKALGQWILDNNIHSPEAEFDDLFVIPLPSTDLVTNFVVASKKGHEPELHSDFIEYLYVIKGSCTMNFDGKEHSYNAGNIIAIPPDVIHFAVVTSLQPMLALVQRQLTA